FPNSGGLPIIVNDQLIGAIGVGGSAPRIAQGWSDEICAHKALTAVLGPQAPLLEDLPPKPPVNRGNAPGPRFDLPQGVVPRSSLPPEFVVSGRAAASIFDGNRFRAKLRRRLQGRVAPGPPSTVAPHPSTSSTLTVLLCIRNAVTVRYTPTS